jgi:hypothetical protein
MEATIPNTSKFPSEILAIQFCGKLAGRGWRRGQWIGVAAHSPNHAKKAESLQELGFLLSLLHHLHHCVLACLRSYSVLRVRAPRARRCEAKK